MINRVVLITGGNSGIGRSAALAFAGDGTKVVISARGTEQGEQVAHEISTLGGEAIFVRADMACAEEIEALVSKTVNEYGRLDCAFNNAATEGVLKPMTDVNEEEFDQITSVNLKGVWLCMKYEIRQMLSQQPSGGAIVNTSSINGLGGVPQGSIYAATKAGVLALTKSAAQEYARQGVRINALVAGAFRTPMLERVFEKASGGAQEDARVVAEQTAQMVPLGRIGNPEEAAQAVVWLCSDASSYVTGHSMIVDGGVTAWAR